MPPRTLPEPAEILREMVKINTVNAAPGGWDFPERPLAEMLEGLAGELGLATQRLPIADKGYNLLVHPPRRAAAPSILLESHLDTVGVTGMTIDPFGAVESGGRLYGRGACDTKGTGAAMLWALATYAADGAGPNDAVMLFTVDEEVSKTGIRAFATGQLAELGWRFAAAVVGEPTRLRPVVAHNGCLRWEIRTEGVAAHSSNPANGRSAISMMARVILALEAQYIPGIRASHPLTGKAQCSINLVQGGVASNIIPEKCLIVVDRRLVPGERAEDVQPEVEKVLEELRRAAPGLRVQQAEPGMGDLPLDPRGAEAFIATLAGVLRDAGRPSEPCGVPFGTDASDLAAAGIPSVVLGPGDIAQAHTADEWIDLAELTAGADIYLRLLRTPLGGPA